MLHEIFKGMDNAAELINENFLNGSIIEAGSNDNGHYFKLSNGFQVMYRRGIVMGSGLTNIPITFPQSFSDTDNLLVLPVTSTSDVQYAFENEVRLNRSSVTVNGCSFFAKRNVYQSAFADYIAVGRWK